MNIIKQKKEKYDLTRIANKKFKWFFFNQKNGSSLCCDFTRNDCIYSLIFAFDHKSVNIDAELVFSFGCCCFPYCLFQFPTNLTSIHRLKFSVRNFCSICIVVIFFSFVMCRLFCCHLNLFHFFQSAVLIYVYKISSFSLFIYWFND